MALVLKTGIELAASTPRAMRMLVGTLPKKGTGSEALQTFIGVYRLAVTTLYGNWSRGDPAWQAADRLCSELTLAWIDVHRPRLARDDLLLPTKSTGVAWGNAQLSYHLMHNYALRVKDRSARDGNFPPPLLAGPSELRTEEVCTLTLMVLQLSSQATATGSSQLAQALAHILDIDRLSQTDIHMVILSGAMQQQLKTDQPESARDWGLLLGQRVRDKRLAAHAAKRTVAINTVMVAVVKSGDGELANRVMSMLNPHTAANYFAPDHYLSELLVDERGVSASVDAVRDFVLAGRSREEYILQVAMSRFGHLSSATVLRVLRDSLKCTGTPQSRRVNLDMNQLVPRVMAIEHLDENHLAMMELPVFDDLVLSLKPSPLATLLAKAPSIAAVRQCLTKVPAKTVRDIAPLALKRCTNGRDVRSAYSRIKVCEHLVFWETLCARVAPSEFASKVKRAADHAEQVIKDMDERPAEPKAKRSKRSKSKPLE